MCEVILMKLCCKQMQENQLKNHVYFSTKSSLTSLPMASAMYIFAIGMHLSGHHERTNSSLWNRSMEEL